MTPQQEFDLIERYHQGKLTASELADFERIQAEDEEFAGKILEYNQLAKGIKTFYQQDFFNKMEEWDQQSASPQNSNLFKKYPAYWKAAAALLLIMVPVSIWLVTSSPSSQALYNQYYQTYPDIISSRSLENTMQEAMESYNNKNYEVAIEQLEQYLRMDKSSSMARLYLAESYLASDQWQKAEIIYQELKGETTYRDLAQWRLALIYLKEDQPEQSKAQLREILNTSSHDYATQAKELLEKIK
ncbi:MAG: tetratricopeptide repeat protein [Bacteroidota bacterium]